MLLRRYIGSKDVKALTDNRGRPIFMDPAATKKSSNYCWDSAAMNVMLEGIRQDERSGRKGMLVLDLCTPLVNATDGQTSKERAQQVLQVCCATPQPCRSHCCRLMPLVCHAAIPDMDRVVRHWQGRVPTNL